MFKSVIESYHENLHYLTLRISNGLCVTMFVNLQDIRNVVQ